MRWEEMPKGHTAVAELVRQFETHCRLEGKPETTCRWYREILGKFLEWAGDVCLDELTLEKVRGYLGYLKSRPRYAGHPTTPSNGETVSAYTFRHHAVVLRVFARWLRDEGYTAEHRLERVKTPQVPETLVEVLTPEEIKRVLESESPSTGNGSRNHAMLVLALDTGLRMSEITALERRNLDLDQGFLRAFGKGSKERIVPFGYTTTKALQRYLLHFRPQPALPQYDYVFLGRDGCPLAKGAMVTVARQVARRTGVDRFHWHLLRHTFAVNYLVNGGDPFSLQRILGHTTLEMVRRY
ncbi:MAG TPA: tyrosine-type recombinase/integrase, partial [Dehalococcoidia bacterium]|nr:tyrosine-type recombinase/integrase [Dehalococcoidia bacterium]